MNSSKAGMARTICLASCALLVFLYAIKTLVLWPKSFDTRLVIFVLQSLPFLALLPGLLQRRWRSYAWLCFIVLLYFMNAVLALFSPERQPVDWLVLLAVVSVFMAAMMFIRWRRVELEASRSTS
ncbi:MAG: DUF2069 domain-containing protein [Pseudomonadales bacterium]